MRRTLVIATATAALAGCSLSGYQDSTGAGRGMTQLRADYETCFNTLPGGTSYDPNIMKACMRNHGWGEK